MLKWGLFFFGGVGGGVVLMLLITAAVPLLFPSWGIPFCDSFLKHSLLTNFESKRHSKGRCMKGSS